MASEQIVSSRTESGEGRILEIGDGDGQLSWLAHPILHSIQLYPEDSEGQERLFAAYLAKMYAEQSDAVGEESNSLTRALLSSHLREYHSIIPILFRADRPPARVLKDGTGRRVRGYIAGEVLLFLLACAHHHPEYKSKMAAVEALAESDDPIDEYRGLGKTNRRGEDFPASPSLVTKAWPQYRTVSHLHAALTLETEKKERDGSLREPGEEPSPEEMAELPETTLVRLAHAEWLRREGIRHGILAPQKAWRTPPSLVLPSVSISIPPLPEVVLERLNARLSGELPSN